MPSKSGLAVFNDAIGKSRGGWNTKIHLVAANARTAIIFCLSPGEAHDAPVGRQLLLELGPLPVEVPLGMGRAYESDETRQLVLKLNMIPVVPPQSNRREPWDTIANFTRNAIRWSACSDD
jgi:hypothetical protein